MVNITAEIYLSTLVRLESIFFNDEEVNNVRHLFIIILLLLVLLMVGSLVDTLCRLFFFKDS